MHSLRQFIVLLYARGPSQFLFFQSFNKSEMVLRSKEIIRTFRWVKITQDRSSFSKLCNLEYKNWWKSKKIHGLHWINFFFTLLKDFGHHTNFRFFKWFFLFRHICLLCNVNRLCNMYLIRRKKAIGQETDWTVITYVVVFWEDYHFLLADAFLESLNKENLGSLA